MIQANELRIGNLVYINPTALFSGEKQLINMPFKIENIEKDGVKLSGLYSIEKYNDLKPIPITEKWLLKFGFLQMSGIEGKVYRLDLTFIRVEGNDFYYLLCKSYNKKIDFIHQVQNLYFAVLGKELEII